jgi:predicted dehydrogenase
MAEYHVKKFSALPGVTVSACADRSPDKARWFAQRLGIPRWFASAAELAASGGVDCVSTALVDAGHSRAALEALRRRLPVFAEKPLARTVAEARALLDAAGAADVPVMVNFSKRNAPAVMHARRIVSEGRIGRILGGAFTYLQSWLVQDSWGRWDVSPRWRWRLSPAQSTEGVIGDLASHLLDAIRAILGEIAWVSCQATALTPDPERPGEPGVPDSCAAVLRLEQGSLLAMRTSWRARGFLDELAFQLEGESGSLSVNLTQSREIVRVFDPRGDRWSEEKGPFSASTYEQFVERVRGVGREGPDFSDGLAVQRLIDACAVSAREGTAVGLPRQEVA